MVKIKGSIERQVDGRAAGQVDFFLQSRAVKDVSNGDFRLLRLGWLVAAFDVQDHLQPAVGDAVHVGAELVKGKIFHRLIGHVLYGIDRLCAALGPNRGIEGD